MNTPSNVSPTRTLHLYDVICIIVGIIIGSAIYQTPTNIAGMLGSGWWIMAVWILGGVLAFLGALCYAELASAYPKEGGDYFFLHHTYGSWAGFLYAWGRLWVIHSGNIAMMAYIAGNYAAELFPFPYAATIFSICAVLLFTWINCIGLQPGKWTQNLLATAQVLGLGTVIFTAFLFSSPPVEATQTMEPISFGLGTFFLASVFVQLSYGGWSDCAFVAAEVKNPQKNIFRSLMWGLGIVTVIYCLINAALLYALGADGMAASSSIMSELMQSVFGSAGGIFISVIVVICALGSVNGMILVGGRIYHAFGNDHNLFKALSGWNPQSSTPTTALIMQAFVSCVLLLIGTFEDLVIYTSAAHWLFMAMVGISLIVLRIRESNVERPYRVPLYPVIPVLYIIVCCLLLYSSFNYGNFYGNQYAEEHGVSITKYGAWIGFWIVLSGLPFYGLSRIISHSTRR